MHMLKAMLVHHKFNLPFLSRIFPAPTETSEENQTPCTGQVTLRYTPPLQEIVGCS